MSQDFVSFSEEAKKSIPRDLIERVQLSNELKVEHICKSFGTQIPEGEKIKLVEMMNSVFFSGYFQARSDIASAILGKGTLQ